MPGPREIGSVVTAFCVYMVAIGLLEPPLTAQTSTNEVHITPRSAASTISTSRSSMRPGGAMIPLIRTETALVLVPVSVTDPSERFVTGLKQENFKIFENKKPQTIQNFSKEHVPVSIGIILDVSGSMKDKVERVREAVTQFCEAANPDDEFFMITFSDQARVAVDFTLSSEDIERDLLFVQPKGRTSLLDAIQLGLHKMQRSRYGRKALLIISDGGDNHSRHSEKQIKALSKESDVMVYSIGIFDRYVPTVEEMEGPALLSELAEPTGGRAYTMNNASEIAVVARRIGMELRTQYVLGYRPRNSTGDGRWHKIRVKLMLPRKFSFLRTHAKTGYYASAQY